MPRRRRIRLLKLAAECPRCAYPVQESIPASERERYAADDPGRVVRFVACDERHCHRIYPITARAYQEATVEVGERAARA